MYRTPPLLLPLEPLKSFCEDASQHEASERRGGGGARDRFLACGDDLKVDDGVVATGHLMALREPRRKQQMRPMSPRRPPTTRPTNHTLRRSRSCRAQIGIAGELSVAAVAPRLN